MPPLSEDHRPWPRLRLTRVEVENYKSLDRLSLDLPAPGASDELDAFVLGSRNGVGKTSLLECCALGVVAAVFPHILKRETGPREAFDPHDLLVRSGAATAKIGGALTIEAPDDHVAVSIALEIGRSGFKPKTEGGADFRRMFGRNLHPALLAEEEWVDSLLGMNSEPLVMPPVLLFHSYRKVVEGSAGLGAMVDSTSSRRRFTTGRYGTNALSTFKWVLIQALMARSGLFEGLESPGDNQAILDKLNGLIRDFAGGTVDKLRPGPKGTLELRVAPVNGGPSFSFDGLSSGQKEIIATLFLIWYTTLDQPSIVLIDEPELHLNAEWQRMFVRQLGEMAPHNEYILATHSEEIFASVSEDRRLLLQ